MTQNGGTISGVGLGRFKQVVRVAGHLCQAQEKETTSTPPFTWRLTRTEGGNAARHAMWPTNVRQ